ncbi:MAG: YbjN domain-containing protein [Muribaculaceae bacterium]|nr:YbjN domain-containing protein [Muribaculaceae bacterium]
MTAKEYLIEYLSSEGYRYEENPNSGSIAFKFEGVRYVFINNSGSQLLQLVIFFYDVNEDNRMAVLEACNRVNSEKAMVKFTCDEDSIWANWEDIVPEEGYDLSRIEMALNMLRGAVGNVFDILNGDAE